MALRTSDPSAVLCRPSTMRSRFGCETPKVPRRIRYACGLLASAGGRECSRLQNPDLAAKTAGMGRETREMRPRTPVTAAQDACERACETTVTSCVYRCSVTLQTAG